MATPSSCETLCDSLTPPLKRPSGSASSSSRQAASVMLAGTHFALIPDTHIRRAMSNRSALVQQRKFRLGQEPIVVAQRIALPDDQVVIRLRLGDDTQDLTRAQLKRTLHYESKPPGEVEPRIGQLHSPRLHIPALGPAETIADWLKRVPDASAMFDRLGLRVFDRLCTVAKTTIDPHGLLEVDFDAALLPPRKGFCCCQRQEEFDDHPIGRDYEYVSINKCGAEGREATQHIGPYKTMIRSQCVEAGKCSRSAVILP